MPKIRTVGVYAGGLLVLLSITVWIGLSVYVNQSSLPKGLSVSGWSTKGISSAEFAARLKEKVDQFGNRKVYLSFDSSAKAVQTFQLKPALLSFKDLGVLSNASEIVREVQSIQEGSLFHRAQKRWQYRSLDLKLSFSINERSFEKKVTSQWPQLQKEPVNARREITETDEIRIIPEINAYRVDVTQLRALFVNKLSEQWHLLVVQPSDPNERQLQITTPLVVKKPAVTAQLLSSQGIHRVVGQFSTTFVKTESGRTHNIEATAQSMQDMLLAPGEVFDYSKIIQKTERTLGYQEAPVIFNGKLVPGVGGGICQVSSTLYNAVLRTGLEIVERRNHSLPISYVPLGQDATFADGYINFRFRNNTAHYLLIHTVITDTQITIKLFGDTPQQYEYDIESKVVENLDPPVKYLTNPQLAANKQEILQKGKSGYIVETYRYKKENGVTISKERISRDTYSPQPTLIATGNQTKSLKDQQRNPQQNENNLLEDGVRGPKFR